MPLISVIIAVYNNEKYIECAVASIENQGFDDYEIIIVDDGSTDNTPVIVDRLSLKNRCISVIHQENQWIYASFNRGIAEAHGDYIYILNSDDKLAKGSLRSLATIIEKYDYPDVIWTKVSSCVCDQNQRIISKKDMNSEVTKESYFRKSGGSFEELLIADRTGLMANQANLYCARIAKRIPFRNDYFGADRLYNLEIAKYINSFAICDKEVYLFHKYDDGKGNASAGKYYGYEQDMYNEFYNCYKKMLGELNVYCDDNMWPEKRRRKNRFSNQMKCLLYFCEDKTLEEKLRIILEDFIDDIILECTKDSGGEELDARILSILRQYFLDDHTIEESSEMYFVFEMLESLLRYEKDDDDIVKIRRGVFHPLNPNNVGIRFYNMLLNANI